MRWAAGATQTIGDPGRGAFDVGFVLRLRADAGNAQQFIQVVQVLFTLLFDVPVQIHGPPPAEIASPDTGEAWPFYERGHAHRKVGAFADWPNVQVQRRNIESSSKLTVKTLERTMELLWQTSSMNANGAVHGRFCAST